MRTWSLEEAFVKAYSAVAVAVQGGLDFFARLEAVTRPMGHDDDGQEPNEYEPGLDDEELRAVRNLLTAADGTSFATLHEIVQRWGNPSFAGAAASLDGTSGPFREKKQWSNPLPGDPTAPHKSSGALPFIPAGENWLCPKCQAHVVWVGEKVGESGWTCLGCHALWLPNGREIVGPQSSPTPPGDSPSEGQPPVPSEGHPQTCCDCCGKPARFDELLTGDGGESWVCKSCANELSATSPEHLFLGFDGGEAQPPSTKPAGQPDVAVSDPLAEAIRSTFDEVRDARVLCYITDSKFERRLTFELMSWTLTDGGMTTKWMSHDERRAWLEEITKPQK